MITFYLNDNFLPYHLACLTNFQHALLPTSYSSPPSLLLRTFSRQGTQCSIDCPGTLSVDKVDLELIDLLVSVFQLLEVKTCAPTACLKIFKILIWLQNFSLPFPPSNPLKYSSVHLSTFFSCITHWVHLMLDVPPWSSRGAWPIYQWSSCHREKIWCFIPQKPSLPAKCEALSSPPDSMLEF